MHESATPSLSQGDRLGPYEILVPLARGGMGEVYRARDTRLDRVVAIKVLPPNLSRDADRRKRFEQEARTVSGLQHPHICALYDVGEQEGRAFLVMEMLEGETLTGRLSRGAMSIELVLRHGWEIAGALNAAHRQGVVHRDLKPSNVMLTRAGAKLLDFGLAKMSLQSSWPLLAQGSQLTTDPLTAEGIIVGTLQYMAPEQLEGLEADARSDLFSFGAVLYEMASGQKAFTGKTQASLIGAILHTDPPPVSSLRPLLPTALDRVVLKCLAKDPERRWQTAHDLADELGWIAQGSSASMLIPALPGRRALRRVAPLLVAGILGALVTGVASRLAVDRPVAVPPVRSTILLPPQHTLSAHDGGLALSPDGRRLAFVAVAPGGKPMLWVRPLHGLTAQPLVGTEGAVAPFWSPDGRYVAFFAEKKLRRIEASGGAVEALADAALGRGGTWSAGGTILFTPDVGGPIHKVSQEGGPSTPVTRTDPARGEGSHRWPAFLPDGRHFLYIAWRGSGTAGHTIYMGSLDGGEPRPLLRAASSAVYAPPGYLLFVRQGTLQAQRFDGERLQLSGEPFPVGDAVQSSPLTGAAPFSAASARALVYQSGPELEHSELLWMDRQGKPLGAVAVRGVESSPRLSPDGRRMALTVRDYVTNDIDLWLYDQPRRATIRLTNDPAEDSFPIWSPDGGRIVFTSTRNGAAGDLYTEDVASGAEQLLLSTPERKVPTHWSPDGRYILFTATGAETRTDVWLLSVADGMARPFLKTPLEEGEAEFSPDGRWVAYRSQEPGRTEVFVRPFPGPGTQVQVSASSGKMPRWSADGREVIYADSEWKLVSVPVRIDGGLDVGAPRPLFEARLRDVGFRQYDVTPDGQRFVVSRVSPLVNPNPITLALDWTAELAR